MAAVELTWIQMIMTVNLDHHPIWVGCFLLAAGVGGLFLLLYLLVYFTGFEL
jgi:hypothetical protein